MIVRDATDSQTQCTAHRVHSSNRGARLCCYRTEAVVDDGCRSTELLALIPRQTRAIYAQELREFAWLRWPVLDVSVQGHPLPGLSARHVLQDLLATRSVPKARQKPGIRSVDTLVESASDEAGAQLVGQQLQRLGIAGAYAPCTAEHDGYLGVGGEFFLQKGQPLEQGVLRGLVWAHVDATSGMPKHSFMVNHAVKIKIQNHVSGARRRRRDVGSRAACGHACHVGIFTPCDVLVVGDLGGQGASAYGVPRPAPRH